MKARLAARLGVLFFFSLAGLYKKMYICRAKDINSMTTIVERTPSRVTVSMSIRRWNRMLQLEETYKLARIIKRSMKQVESEPSMTPEEAVSILRAL